MWRVVIEKGVLSSYLNKGGLQYSTGDLKLMNVFIKDLVYSAYAMYIAVIPAIN